MWGTNSTVLTNCGTTVHNPKGYYPLSVHHYSSGPVTRLRNPLDVASLHMMGERDTAVPPEESRALAEAFASGSGSGDDDSGLTGGLDVGSKEAEKAVGRGGVSPGGGGDRPQIWRQVLEHGSGHCVPQRAGDVAVIR